MKWFVHQFTGISLKVYHIYILKIGAAEGGGVKEFSFSWGIEVGDGQKEWNTLKINAIKFIYQHSPWQLQRSLYKHS